MAEAEEDDEGFLFFPIFRGVCYSFRLRLRADLSVEELGVTNPMVAEQLANPASGLSAKASALGLLPLSPPPYHMHQHAHPHFPLS